MGQLTYKVFLYQGVELGLKTRVEKARAWLDLHALHMKGVNEFSINRSDMLDVELFRLHGLGRVIRLDHRGGRVYLSVVRFMIGQFAIINFLATGRLYKQLEDIVRPI